MLDQLKAVINPFEVKIKKMEIEVLVAIKLPNCRSLQADWEVFNLIFFNFFQNAVKYNFQDGKIIICIEMEDEPPGADQLKQELRRSKIRVQVINTGEGIDKDRQKLLFKPFLELQQKQSMQLVKDNSIGLGLSCSNDLAREMGGRVKLEASVKNKFTAFSFSMGVSYNPIDSAFINVEYVENDENLKPIDFAQTHPELQGYLDSIGVSSAAEFRFESKFECLQEIVESAKVSINRKLF